MANIVNIVASVNFKDMNKKRAGKELKKISHVKMHKGELTGQGSQSKQQINGRKNKSPSVLSLVLP